MENKENVSRMLPMLSDVDSKSLRKTCKSFKKRDALAEVRTPTRILSAKYPPRRGIDSQEADPAKLPEYSAKIILVGSFNVGKTSIVNRYCFDKYETSVRSTLSVEFITKKMIVNNCAMRVQIWDTPGQGRYRCLTEGFYRGSLGAVLVYDISNLSSFEELSGSEGWLQCLRQRIGPEVPIMLLGNKSDLSPQRQVSTERAMVFAEENGLGFMETSAATQANVSQAFESLLLQVSSNLHNSQFDAKADKDMDTITLDDLKRQGVLPQSAQKNYHRQASEARGRRSRCC